MIVHSPAATARSVLLALAFTALVSPAPAQTPSANSVALAKDIIAVKGSAAGFNVVVPGVIERVKAMLLQTNPMLSKDLNEVALKLRTDYASKMGEPLTEAAKLYASKFSEQELKTILAFYKSPVGKKVIEQEPAIFEQSMQNLDEWADKLSQDMLIKFRVEMKKKGHDL
jgi:hypothetical protein